MEHRQEENIYEAESTGKIVSDLFSGKLSLEQALQSLRTRLLDLSSRNRLLNYRYPKGRSFQFVDEPNLNLVFNRLIDGKSLLVNFVPDPPPNTYVDKRPDVKTYAQSIGINIAAEFSPSSCGSSSANKHTPKLQALYYPADLDKLCRKLSSEARTIIEETGTNMLYLVFGFLEFYEREDSERPMLAPLLAVPVTLEKGDIDHETRTYQYSIVYSGEDVYENQTLHEKLSQDFSFQLPEFEEEEDPVSYFSKVQRAVQKKKRWQVRYQLTLGFLSFGKLAIWNDLDPKKWPDLLRHPLLKEVFSGNSGQGASLFPEDYDIDKHPQGDLPIIYDADSSQHSAIIDVLSGKNMVINGPPGTGKSQTITNVIAAVLQAGKKVLFVSEKLAALEVVRHRLNHANLGHFCLELHSHKTQKKKLLSDIQERLDERFQLPPQLQDKLSSLKRHKKELNRYAELMASRVGNNIGLTVHEIFWRTEYWRQIISKLANAVQSLFLADASKWSYDNIELRRAKIEALGQLYTAISSFDTTHPWWGFTPQPLAPGDDEAIGRIIKEALSLAENLVECVLDYQAKTGKDEPALVALERLYKAFQTLPEPPDNLKGDLIPRVFSGQDPLGRHNRDCVTRVICKVERARDLNKQADAQLVPNCELDYDNAEPIVTACSKELVPAAFSVSLHTLEELVAAAQQALDRFERVVSQILCAFLPIHAGTLESLNAKIEKIAPLALLSQPIRGITDGASALSREAARLSQSLNRVTGIATRRGIDFDGSPESVAHLGRHDGIEEVLTGVEVDDTVIAKTQQAADHLLSELPIAELNSRQLKLHGLYEQIARILEEITGYAQQLGMQFDGTPSAIAQLNTLGQIASCAPYDLLDYRCSSLAHPRTLELVTAAEEACAMEKTQREWLEQEFYLDSLPSADDLKAAIRAFRRGDSLFNIFNSEWRAAKSLFHGICKTKSKCNAADYETMISGIVSWMEHRASFTANNEFKDAFGTLFKGLDTDFSKIRRLHAWYVESQTEILKNPGFIESIDLTVLDSRKINQLAALSSRLQAIYAELNACVAISKELLGPISYQLESVLSHSGWAEYNQKVLQVAEVLKIDSTFLGRYVRQDVSPKRAVEVLNAKLEILSARSDFDALNQGLEELHRAIEHFLPGITLVPCRHWSEYLSQVSNMAHVANELGGFVSEYGTGEMTIADVQFFFESKLGMDFALEKFSSLPQKSMAQDWHSYISVAARRVQAGSHLVRILRPVGVDGKTVKEIVVGLSARKDANTLISEIANDAAVTVMLQDLFQGIETDLESLGVTLSWCEAVIDNKVIRNSVLNAVMLSPQAVENFYWAQRSLRTIANLHEAVKAKLNELMEFGSLNWDAWNSGGQGKTKGEFAGTIKQRVGAAAGDVEAVLPWAKYHAERVECRKILLGDFVTALEQKKLPPDAVGSVFEFVCYRSIGRSIYKSFPELEGFAGAKHEKKRAEFIALDQEIISLTGKSFAYEIDKMKKVPDGESGYRAHERTEMQLIRHELGKQRRHLPIRQLINRAGRAIQSLKPCFMMGPMSVAQYLEQGAVEFDMVVMDEASQLRPEEALGAIARGKQLVVVGDPKQLPPTNFFDRMLDGGDEDEDDGTPAVLSGSESILDICQQLFHPIRTLRWHYRSQHESLIAFSNYHFYHGKLVVFPSPFDRNNRLGLRYRYIKNGVYKDRQNVPEAQRVVDAVIEHMMKHPGESLGVVTLNQTQRDLIEDLFDKKLRNIEEAQTYISSWEEDGWPFFVKNLENVQGDERDVIFISTTFGKVIGTDKVRQNFGPISRSDGWRRLNVLFTRARRKIELFTSMLPEDIVLEAKTPTGTKALRDYLDFAKRGILTSTSIPGREPDSDFEIAVGGVLRNRGYEIVPQLGVTGFFIDLAVRNPDRPGEFLAAVECDGATYHSSNSARDRDRIRQTILESLGWKDRIWRIWSTDWFYDPRRESERLLAFLEERRKAISLEPAPEYDLDDDSVEPEEAQKAFAEMGLDVTTDPALSISEEDLFVEVGDRVTYCFINKPEERRSVMIVDTDSNPRLSLINENAPLAKALLNSTIGDEPELEVKGSPTRVIRVLKIQRQERLLM